MKIKFGIYFLFILLLGLGSCTSSRNVTYFQTNESKRGEIVDLPSYRNKNTVRFRPDDILGITVNVPTEQSVASDYNLPPIPMLTQGSNVTTDYVAQGSTRPAYQIRKDGTIDFPVIGIIKVAGYTQEELENYLKQRLMQTLLEPPIVTVRLMNFTFTVLGEVSSPGKKVVERDNINLFEALAMAGDMTVFGVRDDITLLREKPDGGYQRINLDISREDIISSPYYFLQQNDALYIRPNNAKAQQADISPILNVVFSVSGFVMSLVTFVLMLTK